MYSTHNLCLLWFSVILLMKYYVLHISNIGKNIILYHQNITLYKTIIIYTHLIKKKKDSDKNSFQICINFVWPDFIKANKTLINIIRQKCLVMQKAFIHWYASRASTFCVLLLSYWLWLLPVPLSGFWPSKHYYSMVVMVDGSPISHGSTKQKNANENPSWRCITCEWTSKFG